MKIIQGIVIPTVALGLAAFGCSAALAQNTQAPESAPPAASSQHNTSEPSAATPGTEATPATTSETGSHAGKTSQEDTQRFVSQAAYANDSEIADARYALEHSQSPEVKQFAQKMIEDHTKAGEQLKQIASNEGYTVPSGLTHKERSAMQRLEKDQGSEFNTAYSKEEEQDHREVIAMFKRAEQNERIAPKVREFARMTLPTLQDHLQMANKLVASTAASRKAG